MSRRHHAVPGPVTKGRGLGARTSDIARLRHMPRWDLWLRLNTRWQGRDDDDDPPPCPAGARPHGPAPIDAGVAALVAA
jgi:hypothetical protein